MTYAVLQHGVRTALVGDYVYTAYCAWPDTPRGQYDEEIDVLAQGHGRPSLAAVKRCAQAHLDEPGNYDKGGRVMRLVRRW